MCFLKKVTLIFFCFFYFIIACGIHLNFHYCGGKLKGISLFLKGEESCCGTKKKSKGCCKEKSLVFKVKTAHHSTSKVILPSPQSEQFFAMFEINDFKIQSPIIDLIGVPECNAPPFYDSDPVYLLNKNFRI